MTKQDDTIYYRLWAMSGNCIPLAAATVCLLLAATICCAPNRFGSNDVQDMYVGMHVVSTFMLTPAFLKFCLGSYLAVFVLVRTKDPLFFASRAEVTHDEVGRALAFLIFAPLVFASLLTFYGCLTILKTFHNLVFWPEHA